ncbi:OLC1v1032987C1 [Oldenlandia corymbosa var. corymbosa]|uniref:OLC1v1032987C1 n=1 Tax=Oldenlandia corymbosa var. corymbosa TaxID=529605 RepID=A0AAV1CQ04_OLDCO|nr:OLC1v1032987C1 [Oldenlandia corymbosa var. corymbosa]
MRPEIAYLGNLPFVMRPDLPPRERVVEILTDLGSFYQAAAELSEAVGPWELEPPRVDSAVRQIEIYHHPLWQRYYKEMHLTHGFGMKVPPFDYYDTYSATILPYKFTEADGVTTSAEINEMCNKCLKRFIESHEPCQNSSLLIS